MGPRLTALLVVAMAAVGLAAAPTDLVSLLEDRTHARLHEQKAAAMADGGSAMVPETQTGFTACVGGMAGPFPCDGIDLLSFTPLADLGFVPTDLLTGGGASDIWGWTDPESGDEYVLLGHTNGTAAVRVTDPEAPVYLGSIPNTAPVQLIWHDIKVIDHYAIIVSESAMHGVQVLDLHKLRDLDGASPDVPILFDAFYPLSSTQHNVVINQNNATAYVVGGGLVTGLVLSDECSGGLNAIDLSDPLDPRPAGCYDGSLYVHDAECIRYDGPDVEHVGKDICVNYAEDHISIVDVTDITAAEELSRVDYDDVAYTHQGWFTEDRRYILANDELDEQEFGHPTRTLVWDVVDLDAPEFVEAFTTLADGGDRPNSIDHNNYTHQGLAYQSNYTSGLRVVDLAGLDADEPEWDEVAFFDTYPEDDEATFDGTWSNYPYFESGTIAVSGIGEGLFLLRLQDDVRPEPARVGPPFTPPGHYVRPQGPGGS